MPNWFSKLFGQNDDYIEDSDKHRFVFKGLIWENRSAAQDKELVLKKEEGKVYIAEVNIDPTTNEVTKTFRCHSEMVDNKLQSLIDAGIVQSAIAFHNNSKIYLVYKHNNKVRLDSSLRLLRLYRYWALRGVNPNTGETVYLTGNQVGNAIENVLVDITHDYQSSSQYTGYAETGVLYNPSLVADRSICYIDLFDDKRVLRTTIPCQIVYVSSLDFSLAPEENIIGLDIFTSQETIVNGEQMIYLYQGQSIDSLAFHVRALYGDGTTRMLDHEVVTSRLMIELPNIPQNAQPGEIYQVKAKYATNTVDQNGQPLQILTTIDKVKKLIIKEEVISPVTELIVVPLVKASSFNGVPSYRTLLKVFAYRKVDNSLEDVSNKQSLSIGVGFSDATLSGLNMSFVVSLGLGYSNIVSHNEPINLKMDTGILGSWVRLTNSKREFKCLYAYVDNILPGNPGDIVMQLRKENNIAATPAEIMEYAAVLNEYNEKIYPTHFRVRSIIDGSFLHTPSYIDINNTQQFNIVDNPDPSKKLTQYPAYNLNVPYSVIVEFYNKVADKYNLISVLPFYTIIGNIV